MAGLYEDDMVDLTGREKEYAQHKYIAHKGWKTRLCLAVTRSCNLLHASYHYDTVVLLKKDVARLNHHITQLRLISEWLEDEGYDLEHQCADDMLKTYTETDKVLAAAAEVLHAAKAPVPVVQLPQQAQAGEVGAEISMKIASSIKPEKLRGTDNPQSFRFWKKKMKSYFETGRIERLSLDAQHAVVRALIDVELEEVIGDKLDPTVPVFAPADNEEAVCVMSLLQDYVMLKHPLFVRRRAFLTHKMKAGQTVAAWRTQHRQIGNEADLERLTTEELYCLTYVNALGNVPDLGDKILDCQEPTLAKYDALIEAYIHKQGVRTGLGESQASTTASAAAVRERRPRESKEERERKRECYERKICYVCGVTGHMAKTCRTDRKCKCSKCNTVGHKEKACVRPSSNNSSSKARSVEGASRQAEQSGENLQQLSQQAAQLALEYEEEEPSRLNAVYGSAPTPPMLL